MFGLYSSVYSDKQRYLPSLHKEWPRWHAWAAAEQSTSAHTERSARCFLGGEQKGSRALGVCAGSRFRCSVIVSIGNGRVSRAQRAHSLCCDACLFALLPKLCWQSPHCGRGPRVQFLSESGWITELLKSVAWVSRCVCGCWKSCVLTQEDEALLPYLHNYLPLATVLVNSISDSTWNQNKDLHS